MTQNPRLRVGVGALGARQTKNMMGGVGQAGGRQLLPGVGPQRPDTLRIDFVLRVKS